MSITHRITVSSASDSNLATLTGSGNETGVSEVTFGPTNFPTNSSNTNGTFALTVANLQDMYMLADKGAMVRTNGTNTNDVQTITITGTPTGGTLALGYNGVISNPIAYNSNAATVQTALQAMSTIGNGNMTCTGGPFPGSAVVCTFNGSLAPGYRLPLVSNIGGLTGGSPAISITHTTPGQPTDTITLIAGIPLFWQKSAGYTTCPFTANVNSIFVSCNAATRLTIRGLTS